jgi:hypothetical protein
VPPFSARKSGTSAQARQKELLAAAGRTPYYKNRVLADFAAISPVSAEFVRKHPALFRNPLSRPALLDFEHPHVPPPRTVVLETGFRSTASFRVAQSGWESEFESFRPGSLAGATHRLLAIAQGASHPRLTHSLIAFVGPKFGVLTAEDRDLLWTSFGIPVYEQFRGLGGELLASECDAHDGLHIREKDVLFEDSEELIFTSLLQLAEPVLRLSTGIRGRIERRVCGCGDTTPRLMDLERASSPSPFPLLPKAEAASVGC